MVVKKRYLRGLGERWGQLASLGKKLGRVAVHAGPLIDQFKLEVFFEKESVFIFMRWRIFINISHSG